MRKLCLLLTAGLVWGLFVPVAQACLPIVPHDYVSTQTWVEVKGKLELHEIWLDILPARFGGRTAVIKAMGKTFDLVGLTEDRLAELRDGNAVVAGWLTGETTVTVVSVKKVPAVVEQITKRNQVTIRGTIKGEVTRLGVKQYEVTVNGKDYWLDFENREDLRVVADIENGRKVILTGWLRGDHVAEVTELRHDPEEVPHIKGVLIKTGGIAGIHRELKFDSKEMSDVDAYQLHQLIKNARFFELPAQYPLTEVRDGFGYSITIEMDGAKHTVNVSEEQLPEGLRALIDWLEGRRIEKLVRDE